MQQQQLLLKASKRQLLVMQGWSRRQIRRMQRLEVELLLLQARLQEWVSGKVGLRSTLLQQHQQMARASAEAGHLSKGSAADAIGGDEAHPRVRHASILQVLVAMQVSAASAECACCSCWLTSDCLARGTG